MEESFTMSHMSPRSKEERSKKAHNLSHNKVFTSASIENSFSPISVLDESRDKTKKDINIPAFHTVEIAQITPQNPN